MPTPDPKQVDFASPALCLLDRFHGKTFCKERLPGTGRAATGENPIA
jgi:hypothetical protein